MSAGFISTSLQATKEEKEVRLEFLLSVKKIIRPWPLFTFFTSAGPAANRVALEACVEARNQGRELEKEGKEILTNAAKHSPELKMAMETWKEIKFEFDTVDKLDVAHR